MAKEIRSGPSGMTSSSFSARLEIVRAPEV